MRDRTGEGEVAQLPRQLRVVLQCRDDREVAICEHIAFAFARDAGLRGVDVWFAAACATMLATHVAARGGGDVELSVVDWPRPAIEMRASDDGAPLDGYTAELHAARRYASELRVAWHVAAGSLITARLWLRAHS